MNATSTLKVIQPNHRAKALRGEPVRATRAVVAQALRQAIEASSSSQTQEALRIGRDKTVVRDYCNGSKPVHLETVLAMRPDVAKNTLRTLADSIGSPSGGSVDSLLRKVSAATGTLNAEADAALADSVLDAAERIRLRTRALELIEAGHRMLGALADGEGRIG